MVYVFNAVNIYKQTRASGGTTVREYRRMYFFLCISFEVRERANERCVVMCWMCLLSGTSVCVCAVCHSYTAFERLSRNSHHRHRSCNHQLLLNVTAAVSPLCALMLLFKHTTREREADQTSSMQAHVGLNFSAAHFGKSFARGLFDRNVVLRKYYRCMKYLL